MYQYSIHDIPVNTIMKSSNGGKYKIISAKFIKCCGRPLYRYDIEVYYERN